MFTLAAVKIVMIGEISIQESVQSITVWGRSCQSGTSTLSMGYEGNENKSMYMGWWVLTVKAWTGGAKECSLFEYLPWK